MRTVIFTETFLPKIDGIVTVVCLLLDHLLKRDIDFMVVAPDLGVDSYRGKRVVGVPGVTFPWYPELRIGPPTYNTYRAVRDFDPDVMHFIHPFLIGAGGILMAKHLKKPTLASFHLDIAQMANHFGYSFLNPVIWKYTRTNFNVCDYTLAPSKLLQEQLIDKDFRNVGLWKRGVDAEKFHPGFYDDEMRFQLSDGHPEDTILLYVGRLSSEKQIHTLRPILEQVPRTRLAIVGDGPFRGELEDHFVGTPTKFMGYLTGTTLSQAYASADIFTFPSALESFGLVLVEAMAAGLPVVTTLVGGAKDVVTEGVNGYTYPIGDTDRMIESVRRIISMPGNCDQMGAAAREFAETQTGDVMMDEVVECYADMIAGRVPTL
ncbi:MAG TPA: glycosyltransferase family 1 protein [Aggregatilineales bacterium]|nr:glycosyltransferase family 1 protein [Aggregatilineales bacterium]